MIAIAANRTAIQIIGGIFAAVFAIPRAVFAGIFTLLSLPFIGITQAITSSKSEKPKSIIEEHKQTVDLPAPNDKTTVGALFKSYGMRIEDIKRIDKVTTHEKGKPLGVMKLTFKQGAANLAVDLHVDKNNKIVNKDQGKFFKALRKLNVGDLQYQLEQEKAQSRAVLQKV